MWVARGLLGLYSHMLWVRDCTVSHLLDMVRSLALRILIRERDLLYVLEQLGLSLGVGDSYYKYSQKYFNSDGTP